MFPLLDIGISLANLLLGALTDEETGEIIEPPQAIPSPADARLVVPLKPPYYNLPSFATSFSLPNGEIVDVTVNPRTHPEIYAFVRYGLTRKHNAVNVGDVIDIMAEVKPFEVNTALNTLSGDVSVTLAPTYPGRV